MLEGDVTTPTPEQHTITTMDQLPIRVRNFLERAFKACVLLEFKAGGAGSVSEITFVKIRTQADEVLDLAVKPIEYQSDGVGVSAREQHLSLLQKLVAIGKEVPDDAALPFVRVYAVEEFEAAQDKPASLVYAMQRADFTLNDRISEGKFRIDLDHDGLMSPAENDSAWQDYFSWVVSATLQLKAYGLRLGLGEWHLGNVVSHDGRYQFCDDDSLTVSSASMPDEDLISLYLWEAVQGSLRLQVTALSLVDQEVGFPTDQPLRNAQEAAKKRKSLLGQMTTLMSNCYFHNRVTYDAAEPFAKQVITAVDSVVRACNRCEAYHTFFETDLLLAISRLLDLSIRSRAIGNSRFLSHQMPKILKALALAKRTKFKSQASLFDALTYRDTTNQENGYRYDVFDVYNQYLAFFRQINDPELTRAILLAELERNLTNNDDHRPLLVVLRLFIEMGEELGIGVPREVIEAIDHALPPQYLLRGDQASALYCATMIRYFGYKREQNPKALFALFAGLGPIDVQRSFTFDEMLAFRKMLMPIIEQYADGEAIPDDASSLLLTGIGTLLATHQGRGREDQLAWLSEQLEQPSQMQAPLVTYALKTPYLMRDCCNNGIVSADAVVIFCKQPTSYNRRTTSFRKYLEKVRRQATTIERQLRIEYQLSLSSASSSSSEDRRKGVRLSSSPVRLSFGTTTSRSESATEASSSPPLGYSLPISNTSSSGRNSPQDEVDGPVQTAGLSR